MGNTSGVFGARRLPVNINGTRATEHWVARAGVGPWGFYAVAEQSQLAAGHCCESFVGNRDHQRQTTLPEAVW